MTTETVIKFGIYDVTAKDEARYVDAANSLQPFADLRELSRDAFVPSDFATLELNQWVLNGLQKLSPAPTIAEPYVSGWGAVSRAVSSNNAIDNTFQFMYSIPQFSIQFDGVHRSTGITITGHTVDNTYPTKLTVVWRQRATSVLVTYFPDKVSYFLESPIPAYDRIDITIQAINAPSCFAYITRVDFGQLYTFEPSEIISGSIVKEYSPITECLVATQLNFLAHPKADDFNILNAKGVFELLQAGQPIEVFSVIDGVQKLMGSFFLDDWDASDNIRISFKCIDIIGFMAKRDCTGGLFVGKPLDQLLNELYANHEHVTFYVDPGIAATPVSGWLPIMDYRSTLQAILFASGTTAIVQPNGVINVNAHDTSIRASIDSDRKFIGTKITRRKDITDIEVNGYNYYTDTEAGRVDLIDLLIAPGEQTIIFDSPVLPTSLLMTASTAVKWVEQHVNFIRINNTSGVDQPVLITGIPYIVEEKLSRVSRIEPLAGGARSLITATNTTIVSSATSDYVAQNIYDYYALTHRVAFRAILRAESIGQTIQIYADLQNLIIGPITKMDINLVGLVTSFEMVGYVRDIALTNDYQRLNVDTWRLGVRPVV